MALRCPLSSAGRTCHGEDERQQCLDGDHAQRYATVSATSDVTCMGDVASRVR